MASEVLPSNVKIFAEQPDESTLTQVRELAELPFFRNQPVRIMPDCHSSKGCVVGFSAPYGECIIPSIIGLDIGCGMFVIKLSDALLNKTPNEPCSKETLRRLDHIVHTEVPAGYYGRNVARDGPTGFHPNVCKSRFECMLAHLLPRMAEKFDCPADLGTCEAFLAEYDYLCDYLGLSYSLHNLMKSCGTLGSGNHFVELNISEDNEHYLVVHSGSRGLGSAVASRFITAAQLVTKVLLGVESPETLLKQETPFFTHLFNQLQSLKKAPSSERDNAAMKLPITSEEKTQFYSRLRDEVKAEMERDPACAGLSDKEYKAEVTTRVNEKSAAHLARCMTAGPAYDYFRVFPPGTTEENVAHYKSVLTKNPDLAGLYPSLGTEEYIRAMKFCQFFAKINRFVMAFNVYCALLEIKTQQDGIWDANFDPAKRTQVIAAFLETAFYTDCIHNYIDLSSKVMRKGAIRAAKDEILVIPMNMRDGILICRGLGNPDWNCTAPHGAGRVMSRAQAKKQISLDTVIEQMKDVYSTCLKPEVIDEAPDAYKPMNCITKYIKDTCTIVGHWKPLWNFKGIDCVPA